MIPSYRILLVEDDSQLRQAVRLSLERKAYDVCEAGTAAEALDLAEVRRPDLILLDLGLPDGDGLEVAQELRRRPTTTRIPIAIFSGQAVFGRRAEILSSICVGCIPKPVTLERLERDIKLLLTMRRSNTRRYPRYWVEAPIWWRTLGDGGVAETSYATGVVRTISEGGMMVELPTTVLIRKALNLRVRTVGGDLEIVGKVIWSRSRGEEEGGKGSYQHGVQFMDLDPAALTALYSLVGEAGPATR